MPVPWFLTSLSFSHLPPVPRRGRSNPLFLEIYPKDTCCLEAEWMPFLWESLCRVAQGYWANQGSVEWYPWCGDMITKSILHASLHLSECQEQDDTLPVFSLVPFTNIELDTRKHEGLLPLFLASMLFMAKSPPLTLKLLLSCSGSQSSSSHCGRTQFLIPVLTPAWNLEASDVPEMWPFSFPYTTR